MSGKSRGSPGIVRGKLTVATVVACVLLLTLPAAGSVDDLMCADCHDELSVEFKNTPHGIYFSEDSRRANGNCQACHGDGTAHVDDPMPENIYNPAREMATSGENTCLSCHRSGQFGDWEFSQHAGGDVGCSSCHSVHGGFEKSRSAGVPELCYTCHSDVRAAAYMPSHHPIAEGKVSCLDCHNPHGGEAMFTVTGTTRELCLSCHADKEGPFVYEHAPVNEDCQICHTAHGSVADNLLKVSEPTLCLSCHSMHFHATVIGVDGEFDSQQAPERAGVSTPDAWQQGFLTKCTQCHTEVHGSDLPAQSISGGGSALTR